MADQTVGTITVDIRARLDKLEGDLRMAEKLATESQKDIQQRLRRQFEAEDRASGGGGGGGGGMFSGAAAGLARMKTSMVRLTAVAAAFAVAIKGTPVIFEVAKVAAAKLRGDVEGSKAAMESLNSTVEGLTGLLGAARDAVGQMVGKVQSAVFIVQSVLSGSSFADALSASEGIATLWDSTAAAAQRAADAAYQLGNAQARRTAAIIEARTEGIVAGEGPGGLAAKAREIALIAQDKVERLRESGKRGPGFNRLIEAITRESQARIAALKNKTAKAASGDGTTLQTAIGGFKAQNEQRYQLEELRDISGTAVDIKQLLTAFPGLLN